MASAERKGGLIHSVLIMAVPTCILIGYQIHTDVSLVRQVLLNVLADGIHRAHQRCLNDGACDPNQCKRDLVFEAGAEAMAVLQGSYSCICLVHGVGTVAFRDPLGIRCPSQLLSTPDYERKKAAVAKICVVERQEDSLPAPAFTQSHPRLGRPSARCSHSSLPQPGPA